MEPTHDNSARDTTVSQKEGRLKVDVASKRNRRKKYLKKLIKKQ